ncbi:hypothetical protein D3C72_1223030 [compost metagenome]
MWFDAVRQGRNISRVVVEGRYNTQLKAVVVLLPGLNHMLHSCFIAAHSIVRVQGE